MMALQKVKLLSDSSSYSQGVKWLFEYFHSGSIYLYYYGFLHRNV